MGVLCAGSLTEARPAVICCLRLERYLQRQRVPLNSAPGLGPSSADQRP